MLKKLIQGIISEETERLKSFYGSNFQYSLEQYTKEEDGLAQYGVHYSENKNIAIFPRSGYYPKGVYFYFLSSSCLSGKGTGFATDRKWANIGKIHNDRMLIIKEGHPRNFNQNDLMTCLEKLKKLIQTMPSPTIKPNNTQPQFKPVVQLFNQLHAIEKNELGLTNKLLHQLGYDGVVDYDGTLLPIESCQGVMTWPGSFELQISLPTPRKNPGTIPEKRLGSILKRLKHLKNGSLRLDSNQIRQSVQMLPNFYHVWDVSDSRSEFYSYLMMKLDFRYSDAWHEMVEWRELGYRFYEELSENPTTPKEFWEKLQFSSDKAARMIAKDKLKSSFAG